MTRTAIGLAALAASGLIGALAIAGLAVPIRARAE